MEKNFIVMPSLYFIVNLRRSDRGLEITIQNGKVVTLSKFRESYEYFTKLLISAIERKYPVGLAISEDSEILEVERANNDFIGGIVLKDEETFIVQFQGHDGFFKLNRNHLGFDKIYTTLERSRIDSQRVWFIADRELKILDALITEA
jgi:hypothetical protein